jgi:hypothetical protein
MSYLARSNSESGFTSFVDGAVSVLGWLAPKKSALSVLLFWVIVLLRVAPFAPYGVHPKLKICVVASVT